MPISREQFNAQRRPLDERIFEFLAAHDDQAWSPMELIQELEHLDNEADAAIYMNAGYLADGQKVRVAYDAVLRHLVSGGMANAVSVGGVPYFAIVPGVPFKGIAESQREALEAEIE